MKQNSIAACGMNCNLCIAYLREKNKCSGCREMDAYESSYGRKCIIRSCDILKEKNMNFCSDKCDKFPCRRLKNLDKRYKTKYRMSIIENLKNIKEKGIRQFVKEEKEKWKCQYCGSILCVHRDFCLNCEEEMKIIDNLRKDLKENIDEHTKSTAQRFFKEKIKVYGIKTAIVSKISKKHYNEIKDLDKKEIFKLCEDLFSSGFMEESFIACNWSYNLKKAYEEKDFLTFKKWLEKYVDNWATCDTLCNHTIGAFIEKFPKYIKELKKWTKSDNRWVKRASAVTLIIPARKGKFLIDIFGIADILINDNDDLVQKGYGWMLKAASESHQKEVFEYVLRNKKVMPRTSLRYAIEKMPKELKEKAVEK
jgi:3-methyladenine DNA glycosylase AlkD